MDFCFPCLLQCSDPSLTPIRFTSQQCRELERLYKDFPKPSSAFLEQLLNDSPLLSNLDKQHLKLWFQSRRLKERNDEQLFPLMNKNAELKAEHQALLRQNSELRNQASLLNLANQRLKDQLEQQLHQKHSDSSSTITSVSLDRMSRHPFDSDDEEDSSQVQESSSQD